MDVVHQYSSDVSPPNHARALPVSSSFFSAQTARWRKNILWPLESNPPHDRRGNRGGEGRPHAGVRGGGPQDPLQAQGAPGAGGRAGARVPGTVGNLPGACLVYPRAQTQLRVEVDFTSTLDLVILCAFLRELVHPKVTMAEKKSSCSLSFFAFVSLRSARKIFPWN